MKQPRTVSELYPSRWLRAADLNGRTVTVTVQRITLEELHNPRTNQRELIAVAHFGRSKDLALNKTQCLAIADITGSEAFSDWHGRAITLRPGTARNGKPTIDILPPPAPEPAPAANPAPDAAQQPDDSDADSGADDFVEEIDDPFAGMTSEEAFNAL